MRDESQGSDVYAWSWPARLSGDDPYEWRGPVQRVEPQEAPEPSATATPPRPVVAAAQARAQDPEAEATSPLDHIAASGAPEFSKPLEDAWVELPEASDPPSRSRRSRGRNRGAARETSGEIETAGEIEPAADVGAEVEPVVAVDEAGELLDAPAPEVTSVEPAAPATIAIELAPEPEPEPAPQSAPAPEPVLVGAESAVSAAEDPSPSAPAPYDPAEISTPPAAPKRGWWRRGS